jgi:hypothetical protein
MDIIQSIEQKIAVFPRILQQAEQAGINFIRILIINKDQAGYAWLNTQINPAGQIVRKENGTFSENSFQAFFDDKSIMAPNSIDIKVNAGNRVVGNLIIEFSPIKDIDAFKNNLSKAIPEIAPQLTELFLL